MKINTNKKEVKCKSTILQPTLHGVGQSIYVRLIDLNDSRIQLFCMQAFSISLHFHSYLFHHFIIQHDIIKFNPKKLIGLASNSFSYMYIFLNINQYPWHGKTIVRTSK